MSGIPGFLDLVHVLASSGGCRPVGEHQAARDIRPVGGIDSAWNAPDYASLANEIGNGGNLVFVLVDGMGEGILGSLAPDSFLSRHRKCSIESVFPSTTACAMTTLATGLSPAGHGIPGRYMFLPELRLHVNSLSFRARSDNSPLARVPPDRIWPFPSLFRGGKTGQVTVLPGMLADSPFARYLCAGNPVDGYSSIHDAVDRILRAERESHAPGCLFLYIWDLDSLCHEKGPGHEDSLALLRHIDAEMDRLACGLKESSRLVISADHGQIDVDEADRLLLRPGHPLLKHLVTIPYGEPRAAQFLVKPGREDAFRQEFGRSFGDFFSLLQMDSGEALSLFGARPAPGASDISGTSVTSDTVESTSGDSARSSRLSLSPFARKNLGNFLALSRGKSLLVYEDAIFSSRVHRGEHGGNLPEERLVPLIVR